MRHLLVAATILSVLAMATGAHATGPPYGWTISASNTSPYENSASFVPGLSTVYLWFACSTPEPGPGGMAAAEFRICSDNPANALLAVIPQNNYLNAGAPPDLLLAVGGCPTGPLVAANLLVLNNAPGQWCICESSLNGIKGTVDCSPNPEIYALEWVGLDIGTGQPPCGKGEAVCEKPISVEDRSWGQIKSLYR